MRDERQEALRAAIDELYDVFSRHPMAERGHFVGCGPSEEDADILSTTPLREIPWEPLERMSSGYRENKGIRQFQFQLKYFLPRILDLMSEDLARFEYRLEHHSDLAGRLTGAVDRWPTEKGYALLEWAVSLFGFHFNGAWGPTFRSHSGVLLGWIIRMGVPATEILPHWGDFDTPWVLERTEGGRSILVPRA